MVTQLEIPIGSPPQQRGRVVVSGMTERAPLFLVDEAEAVRNSESIYQIVEGRSYKYQFEGDLKFGNYPRIVQPIAHPVGILQPREYVGTLCLEVLDSATGEKVDEIRLEVRSSKTNYREDYRAMLGEIADDCIDIIFSANTPIVQTLSPDFTEESESVLQRFGFLRSVLMGDEFRGAIARIMSYPVTRWAVTSEMQDTRRLRRISGRQVRQIVSGQNRIPLRVDHGNLRNILPTIPREISVDRKIETKDTPENRFVKFVLQSFLRFCEELSQKLVEESRLSEEVDVCRNLLERYLKEGFFREIPDLRSVNLNSPALQRKSGYREVLKAWLMFYYSAVLSWDGLEEVYEVNKRDVALLYEYWSFISLVKMFSGRFGLTDSEQLFESRNGGLEVSLRRGVMSGVSGLFDHNGTGLRFSLNFNRTFGPTECPKPGTWSVTMRPDITLSFWPADMSENDAEEREELIHLHFDSKYRIDRVSGLFNQVIVGTDSDEELASESLDLEESGQVQRQTSVASQGTRGSSSARRSGGVKRDDLLKMHAYKDAIRRSTGAYVLYPGDEDEMKAVFHEIIPGLGAFALSPGTREENLSLIDRFITDVLDNFVNRQSFERGLAESRRHLQH